MRPQKRHESRVFASGLGAKKAGYPGSSLHSLGLRNSDRPECERIKIFYGEDGGEQNNINALRPTLLTRFSI